MFCVGRTLKSEVHLVFLRAKRTDELYHGATVSTGEFLAVNIHGFR